MAIKWARNGSPRNAKHILRIRADGTGGVFNGVLVIIISEIMIFTGVAKECFIECDETLISEQGTPAA